MSKKDKGEQRERIEELLDIEVRGMKAGVYGRQWCEGCGKEGSFSGFICAMAAHTAANRYVCSPCRRGELGTGTGGASSSSLDELILERGFRYCCSCGGKVILEERTVEMARRLPVPCAACSGLDRGRAGRRRYLEHKATQEGGLEQAASRIHWARAGIERLSRQTEDPETD